MRNLPQAYDIANWRGLPFGYRFEDIATDTIVFVHKINDEWVWSGDDSGILRCYCTSGLPPIKLIADRLNGIKPNLPAGEYIHDCEINRLELIDA